VVVIQEEATWEGITRKFPVVEDHVSSNIKYFVVSFQNGLIYYRRKVGKMGF
jgi:hypothetical protein